MVADEIRWGKPRRRAGTCARGSAPRDSIDGVVDLGGNVSEWTTPPARSRGKGRWIYGASWYAVDDGYAGAALGGMQTSARRAETIGFRCAREPGRPAVK